MIRSLIVKEEWISHGYITVLPLPLELNPLLPDILGKYRSEFPLEGGLDQLLPPPLLFSSPAHEADMQVPPPLGWKAAAESVVVAELSLGSVIARPPAPPGQPGQLSIKRPKLATMVSGPGGKRGT